MQAMAQQAQDLEIVLNGSASQVQGWLEFNGLVTKGGATAFADRQSFLSANGLVKAADPLMHYLAVLATEVTDQSQGDLVEALLHTELPTVVASPWFGNSGSFTADVGLGLTARFRTWMTEAVAADATPSIDVAPLSPNGHGKWRPLPGYAVLYIAAASLDQYSSEQGEEGYRYKLDRIRSLLGLKPGELTQLLEVSREGLRKWQAGSPITPRRASQIDDLYSLAMWLATHIRPEALPSFMRRRIPALDGQSPLDLLRGHRWSDLRRIYERAFSLETQR